MTVPVLSIRAMRGLALGLALVGCRAAPPEASVSREFGVVRAATLEDAGRVSDHAELLLPRLRRLLPDLTERRLEVWVQERIELYDGSPYPDHIAGMADFERGRIHLRGADERLRIHLAHELVHVLLGPSWRPLPGILEEGVCDLAAVVVAPEEGRLHHVKRLIEASGYVGGLEASLELTLPIDDPRFAPRRQSLRVQLMVESSPDVAPWDVLALDEGEVFERATGDRGVGLYGMGYLLTLAAVRNVGFDGLNGLCVRAREEGLDQVPAAWALRAAGFPGDPAGPRGDEAWRSAVGRVLGRFLGPGELPELAEILSESLGEAAVDATRGLYPLDVTADEFLHRARPALSLRGRNGSLSLLIVPGFVDAVRTAWDAAPRDA